jgi:hypothetical protein
MEFPLYYGLLHYLRTYQLPNISSNDKKHILQASKYFKENEGQLYYKKKSNDEPRLVIKADENLRKVLEEGHAGTNGGHFGGEATRKKLERNFYWPRMGAMIDEFVKTCETCQRRGKPKKNNPLRSITVSEPFELIGMDLVGPLPETSRGNKYIIVMTEYLTKWVEAKAIPNKRAETIAEFLYDNIITRFGTPKRMLTDQGTEFLNETITALQKVMNIKGIHSSPYHPQTNGQTERMNKTLCEILAKLSQDNKKEWDRWIGSALYAFRTKEHTVTKFTPAFLLYGFQMKTPLELEMLPNTEKPERTAQDHANLIGERLRDVRELAKMNKEKSHERQKKYYDKHVKQTQFKIGDKVLLYDSATQHTHGDKFREIFKEGIYTIQEVLNNGTYRLLDNQNRRTKITTGDRIKRFFERPAWEPIVHINQTRIGTQSRIPIATPRLRITYNTEKEDRIREENERNKHKGKMLPITIKSTDENDKLVEQRQKRIERLKQSGLIPRDEIRVEPITEDMNLYRGPVKLKIKSKNGRQGDDIPSRSQSPTKKNRSN